MPVYIVWFLSKSNFLVCLHFHPTSPSLIPANWHANWSISDSHVATRCRKFVDILIEAQNTWWVFSFRPIYCSAEYIFGFGKLKYSKIHCHWQLTVSLKQWVFLVCYCWDNVLTFALFLKHRQVTFPKLRVECAISSIYI